MNFVGDDGYRNFLVFAPILSSLILDSNKKVTNCILTRILTEKSKPFDANLELAMPNLANGRVLSKFSKFVSVYQSFSPLNSNFIFSL